MWKLLVVWLCGVATLAGTMFGVRREDAAARRHSTAIERAQAAERRGDWKAACDAYDAASAESAPEDFDGYLRVRLAHAIASIRDEKLPATRTALVGMLMEAEQRRVSATLRDDIRFALAKASYDLAWQLRLCGAEDALWRESAAMACEHFHLLASEAMATGSPRTLELQRDLESAVNLMRVDLVQLAGLALPSNCWTNSNCERKAIRERHVRKRASSQKPGRPDEKPGDEPQPGDDRQALGAGAGKGRLGW